MLLMKQEQRVGVNIAIFSGYFRVQMETFPEKE